MAKTREIPVREQLLDRRIKLEQTLDVVPDDAQVQHLIEEGQMSTAEVAQLRALLDRLEEEGHESSGK